MNLFDKNLNSSSVKTEKLLLYVVFGIGIFLRFFYFSEWSLTNDELSALYRLRFDSFSDLITKGIMEDGHPAFVQLFLYFWTIIFGNSPFALRLPFAFASVGSCIYFYLFTKSAINKKAAILALTFFSISSYFITYGQIARPYSMGLFFVLGFAYYALRVSKEEKQNKVYWPFVFFGLLSICTHYFASMQAVILGILFLLISVKTNIKSYLKSSAIIILLFLPHLPITLNHLSIGGVNWVPLPDENFLDAFFDFITNKNKTLYFSVMLVPFILLVFKSIYLKNKWTYILPLLFIVPYQIALYYSHNYSPILQFSVLIFSVPFLIITFFSMVKKTTSIWLVVGISTLLYITGFYSLLENEKIFERKFSNFKKVTRSVANWSAQHQRKFNHLSNSNNSEYLQYYLDETEENINFDIEQFKSAEDLVKARDLLNSSEKPYSILSFSNVRIPLEVYEFAKSNYTKINEEFRGFNSHALLLEKSNMGRDTLLSISPKSFEEWSLNGTLDDSSHNSKTYNVAQGAEYVLTLETSWSKVKREQKSLTTTVELKHSILSDKIILVASIENSEGSVFWRGINSKPYYIKDNWFELKYVLEPNQNFKDNDKVKIYLWNQDKIPFQVRNFRLESFEDSDYNFYQ